MNASHHSEPIRESSNYFDLLCYPNQATEFERLLASVPAGYNALAVQKFQVLPAFRQQFIKAVGFLKTIQRDFTKFPGLALQRIHGMIKVSDSQGINTVGIDPSGQNMRIMAGDVFSQYTGEANPWANPQIRNTGMFLLGVTLLGFLTIFALGASITPAITIALLGVLGLAVFGLLAGFFLSTNFGSVFSEFVTRVSQANITQAGMSLWLGFMAILGAVIQVLLSRQNHLQNQAISGPFDFVKGVMFYTPMQGLVPLLDMTKNALVRGIAAFGMPNLMETPASPKKRDDEVYLDILWPDALTHMSENLQKLIDLIGEKVSKWSHLPKSGYEQVVTYENSMNLRKLLQRHGLQDLEQSIGTQLFFKNDECTGITYATVWPISFRNKVHLVSSICFVMPEIGQFKAESIVEEFDSFSMRKKWQAKHGSDKQWEAYIKLWEINSIKRCSESIEPTFNRLKNLIIEVKTINDIASKPNKKINEMTLDEKRALGLIIQKRFSTLHEIGHAAIQRLIEKPKLAFKFFDVFKKNPGMLTQHGVLKGIGGDNSQYMVWQAFNETWCNKFALYMLIRDAALIEKNGQTVDADLKKMLNFFEGELSSDEMLLFTDYLKYLISLGPEVLTFSKDNEVERSIILRATQATAASHIPQTPEGLKKLFVSLSFWKSLIAGILMGLGVGLWLQSNAAGFILAGVVLLFQLARIVYLQRLWASQPEALKQSQEQWSQPDAENQNQWITNHAWFGQLLRARNFDLGKVRLLEPSVGILSQFFRSGFQLADYNENTKELELHPVALLLPRIFLEAVLSHELKHSQDVKNHPAWLQTRWGRLRLETRAKCSVFKSLLILPVKEQKEKKLLSRETNMLILPINQ